jgi:N-acetylmuramic acid 6-phosphate etherase
MGLSGSTRMQASTVLQLAAGMALFGEIDLATIETQLHELGRSMQLNAIGFLSDFVEAESAIYRDGDYIMYDLADHFITIFTDTTERAPTFSLTPFSHRNSEVLLKKPPSLSYVQIQGAQSADEAWRRLLNRTPRPLNWNDIDPRTSVEYLRAFDFGAGAFAFRESVLKGGAQKTFKIGFADANFHFNLEALKGRLAVPKVLHLLFRHTLLKMLLNIHSTLVMGRIGRFEKNVMTFVYPTNGKLVDRATRYVLALLTEAERKKVTYEMVVRELFKQFEMLPPFESVVLRTVQAFRTA